MIEYFRPLPATPPFSATLLLVCEKLVARPPYLGAWHTAMTLTLYSTDYRIMSSPHKPHPNLLAQSRFAPPSRKQLSSSRDSVRSPTHAAPSSWCRPAAARRTRVKPAAIAVPDREADDAAARTLPAEGGALLHPTLARV